MLSYRMLAMLTRRSAETNVERLKCAILRLVISCKISSSFSFLKKNEPLDRRPMRGIVRNGRFSDNPT